MTFGKDWWIGLPGMGRHDILFYFKQEERRDKLSRIKLNQLWDFRFIELYFRDCWVSKAANKSSRTTLNWQIRCLKSNKLASQQMFFPIREIQHIFVAKLTTIRKMNFFNQFFWSNDSKHLLSLNSKIRSDYSFSRWLTELRQFTFSIKTWLPLFETEIVKQNNWSRLNIICTLR